MGFPVLGGLDYGAYAIRPYAFDRKKDCPFSFPALGGENYGVYAMRPYPFGRKKESHFGFPVPKKDGNQKCTP